MSETKRRRLGIGEVSITVLEDLLQFLPGHHIMDFNYDMNNRLHHTISFMIEGPTLPEVEEGGMVALIRILIEKKDGKISIAKFQP